MLEVLDGTPVGEVARRRPRAQQGHDDLLRAGMELAGEGGMGGATHRAVAARAGCRSGSTSCFFSSLDELLAEAIRHFVTRRSTELARLIDGGAEGGDGDGPDRNATARRRSPPASPPR